MKRKIGEIQDLRCELQLWQAHVREHLRQLKIAVTKCKLIAARMRAAQRRYEASENTAKGITDGTAFLAGTGADGFTNAAKDTSTL